MVNETAPGNDCCSGRRGSGHEAEVIVRSSCEGRRVESFSGNLIPTKQRERTLVSGEALLFQESLVEHRECPVFIDT